MNSKLSFVIIIKRDVSNPDGTPLFFASKMQSSAIINTTFVTNNSSKGGKSETENSMYHLKRCDMPDSDDTGICNPGL